MALRLHGYLPKDVVSKDLDILVCEVWEKLSIIIDDANLVLFSADQDMVFDTGKPMPEHPNGMIFELLDAGGKVLMSETYFSIGGGFISTLADIEQLVAPLKMKATNSTPYGFHSAEEMLEMSAKSGLSVAQMKRFNEKVFLSEEELNNGLDLIWDTMKKCIKRGLSTKGILPGGLNIPRRAKDLHQQLQKIPMILV